jgi:PAS domain-containing protein
LHAALAESATVELAPLSSAGQLVGVALFTFSTPPSDNVHALTRLAAKTFAVALRAADAAESVRALDAERRQLLDAIPLWVYRFEEPTFDTTFVNGAVARAVGRAEDVILRDGGLGSLLVDERDRAALEQAKLTALSEGESPWIDLRFRGTHHRVRMLRTRLYRVSDARRGGWIVEGIGQDVTDELETRTQLVHTDRLASLGALAAGVAHEINNPAAFIMLGIQQLSRLDPREQP